MKGNPGVTTFRHDGRDQIYAFVRGDNGRLYVCFWDATPNITSWRWDDRGQPVGARVNSSPTIITSIQNDSAPEHFLHIFVRGNNGHLYEHFWDGFQWVGWVDHDQPHWTISLAMSPGVAAFRGRYYYEEDAFLADSADRLFVFAWGSSTSASNDSLLWQYLHRDRLWRFQGSLPNPQEYIVSEPAVIKHVFQNTIPYIYAYVVGHDGHLYVNHSADWAASTWHWRDLGQPNANTTATWLMKPGLVSFTHDGEYRIYAFVGGSNGHLWNHFWQGWRQQGQGNWGDLGAPTGTTVASESGVVTFRHEGTDRIYVFVRGSDNHLHVCFWDGLQWHWANLGRPTTGGDDVMAQPQGGNAPVSSAPGVITFTDRIYAFVSGGDNHLHVCYWNGVDSWLWTDLGTP